MLRDLVTIPFDLCHHLGFEIINEDGVFFLLQNPKTIIWILTQIKCRFAIDRHAGDKALQSPGRSECSVAQIILIFNGNANHLVELIFDDINTFPKAIDNIPINLAVGINCAKNWLRK